MSDTSIPKPVDFLLSEHLYTKYAFVGMETWAVVDVLYYDGTYDNLCPKCGRDATFQVIAPDRPVGFARDVHREQILKLQGVKPDFPTFQPGVYTVHAECTRRRTHVQDFLFFVDRVHTVDSKGFPVINFTIQKIGQQPSYGDLRLPEIKKYRSVLTKTLLGEFSRAIGLASHDVGVGSYVYLRRVFEALVEEAHNTALSDCSWDELTYEQSRMGERISQLKGYLPTFLVDHPSMYSLLSKGVHELSEEECLKHFETLRIGIELILDEKLEQRERAKKVQEAKAAIQKALQDTSA